MYGDCLLERPYPEIPLKQNSFSGVGAIEDAPEELLLLLRLFRPGDLVFVGIAVEKVSPNGEVRPLALRRYRVISGIGGDSTRQFVLRVADVEAWELFASTLRSSPSWTATWFQVARRCFLCGSSNEFNPNFQSEVDRVADYIAALEAALVPETDFVSRRLRERTIHLLGSESDPSSLRKMLTDMYSIRSTLVHGSPLSQNQMSVLQDRAYWCKFEELVRELLVTAVAKVPPAETKRRSYLTSLYDVGDEVRANKISGFQNH
jgi:hypothetical protein